MASYSGVKSRIEARRDNMTEPCRVFCITCDDVGEVVAAGPRHHAFGALIDLGTAALLDGRFESEQLTSIVSRVGLAAGAGGPPLLERIAWGPRDDVTAVRERLEGAAEESRTLVVLLDLEPGHPGLAIALGPGLPNMGFTGACSAERLETTLRFIAGDAAAGETPIFADSAEGGGEEEAALMQRLTKLYGG
jgi:hypothetical protein